MVLEGTSSPLLNFGLSHNSLLVYFVSAARIVWKHQYPKAQILFSLWIYLNRTEKKVTKWE
jgi:hypothetical protein